MGRDLVEQLGATVSGDPESGKQSPLVTLGAVAAIAGIAYATDPFRKGFRWPWKKGSTNDSLTEPAGARSTGEQQWRRDWSIDPPRGWQGDMQVNRRYTVAVAKDKAHDALRSIGVLYRIGNDATINEGEDPRQIEQGDAELVSGWLLVPRWAFRSGMSTEEAVYAYESELDRMGASFVTLEPSIAKLDSRDRGLWVRASFAVYQRDY